MADLREFQVGEISTPAPISQKYAVDTSEATRIAGKGQQAAMIIEGVGQAAITGYQYNDQRLNSKAMAEITSGGEDAEAFTDFERIAKARQAAGSNLSAERAKTEAKNLLRSKVTENPRRAEAYKAAYQSYFGSTGGGSGAFTQTAAEKFDESRTTFAFDKFGMDPNLRTTNPTAWEQEFQSRLNLMSQNENAEALTTQIEAGNKLDSLAQSEAFPSTVTNILTNKDSAGHLGSLVSRTLMDAGMAASGEFNAQTSAKAELALNNLKLSMQAQYKQQYPDLGNEEFNAVFKPVLDYIDNVKLGVSGELDLQALQRENSIFTEAAIVDGYRQNPQAARELVQLKNMVQGLPNIPFDLEQHIVKASRAMIAGGTAASNPSNPLSTMDYVNNASDIAALNVLDRYSLQAAGTTITNGDVRQQETAKNAVVRVGKNILNNPTKIKANTYLEYFGVLSQPGVLDSMTPEQQEVAVTSLGGKASQTFLVDTLNKWKSEAGDLQVQYNTATNRIEVVGDSGVGRMSGTKARTVNAQLSKTNVFFKALDNVGLLEGVQSDMGEIFASVGISVVDGKGEQLDPVSYTPIATEQRTRGAWVQQVKDQAPGAPTSTMGDITPVPSDVIGRQARTNEPRPATGRGNDFVISTLAGFEGNSSESVVPPTPTSGVTVGMGFDIGQHSASDLNNLGLSDALVEKLTPYTNTKGENARLLPKLTVSDSEKAEINSAVIKDTLNKVQKATPNYNNLPKNAKAVLVSLVHNFGEGATNYKTYKWIAEGEYDKAIVELRDQTAWKNPELQSRRNQEADLLDDLL